MFDSQPTFRNCSPLASDAGSFDIFVAKYDPDDGTLLWAKRAGGSNIDDGNGIAIDGAGNSYVTGFFSSSVTFGPGETTSSKVGMLVDQCFCLRNGLRLLQAGANFLESFDAGNQLDRVE